MARAKKSTAGGLDGWAWNEIKALPLPWFSGLAILLDLVEITGTWPQGLLDAYIAMIPKADGGYTPLGQRPLSVLPVMYLAHLREWVDGWLPRSVFSLGNDLSSVEAWSLLRWILRMFYPGLVVISCMLWSLMSLSPLILLTGLFWTVLLVAWGYLTGFIRSIFLFIVRSVFGLSLLLVLVSLGEEMVVFPRVVL